MNSEIGNKLNEVIYSIINSYEYQQCIKIKEQMSLNENINNLVLEIKQLQQKVVKENKKVVKEELEKKQLELNNIPIYQEYSNYLSIVNDKIELIKASLNDYFYNKLNNNIM